MTIENERKIRMVDPPRYGVKSFSELIIGDRFYFMSDKKKNVFEIKSDNPISYAMDNEKYSRMAKTADTLKQVFLLRNRKTN